ncbi:ATP-binding protein [Streptomyces sp. NPDC055144]
MLRLSSADGRTVDIQAGWSLVEAWGIEPSNYRATAPEIADCSPIRSAQIVCSLRDLARCLAATGPCRASPLAIDWPTPPAAGHLKTPVAGVFSPSPRSGGRAARSSRLLRRYGCRLQAAKRTAASCWLLKDLGEGWSALSRSTVSWSRPTRDHRGGLYRGPSFGYRPSDAVLPSAGGPLRRRRSAYARGPGAWPSPTHHPRTACGEGRAPVNSPYPPRPRPVVTNPHVVLRWTSSTPNPSAQARAALRRILAQLGLSGEAIGDAVLAVSELVANATEHAPGPYEMRLRLTAAEYICEIEDRDPHVPEIPAFPSDANFAPDPEGRGGGLDALLDLLAERGRGLSIVNELTRGAWGFRCTRTTKVAWARFPANVPRLLTESVA